MFVGAVVLAVAIVALVLHFVDTNVAGGLGGIISDTWDAGRNLWGRVFGGSGGAPPGVNTRPWTSPPIASPWARPFSTPMGLGRWNGVLTAGKRADGTLIRDLKRTMTPKQREMFSNEIHDRKNSVGRGGIDNLSKEELRRIAKEVMSWFS